jgi:hypothetical protein
MSSEISKGVRRGLPLTREERLAMFSIAVLAGLSFFATPYMLIASAAYLCMFSGMLLRRNPKTHPKLMMTGMATDILLVLILEVQRSAIKTASGFSLTYPQQLHILFSLMAVVHYFPVFYLGLKRMKGTASTKQKALHLRLGVMAFAFRTLGFILMFSFLARKTF